MPFLKLKNAKKTKQKTIEHQITESQSGPRDNFLPLYYSKVFTRYHRNLIGFAIKGKWGRQKWKNPLNMMDTVRENKDASNFIRNNLGASKK